MIMICYLLLFPQPPTVLALYHVPVNPPRPIQPLSLRLNLPAPLFHIYHHTQTFLAMDVSISFCSPMHSFCLLFQLNFRFCLHYLQPT